MKRFKKKKKSNLPSNPPVRGWRGGWRCIESKSKKKKKKKGKPKLILEIAFFGRKK